MSVRARAVVAACCLSAGVVAADRLRPGLAAAAVAGAASVVFLGSAWAFHRTSAPRDTGELLPPLPGAAVVLVAAGLAMLGFADLGMRTAAGGGPADVPTRPVTVEGRIAGDPVISGTTTRFHLDARTIGGRPARANVAVRAFGVVPSLRLGDDVALRASLSAIDPSDPFDARLRRRWVDLRATASGGAVQIRGRSSGLLLGAAEGYRRALKEAAAGSLPRADAGLLLGVTIGDESGIPPDLVESFRSSGLSHLTAVSGANVAVVVATAAGALALFRVRKGLRTAGAAALVCLFVVVTRWEPSVLRAAIMALLALEAYAFGRRADTLHGLGVAMAVILVADPFLLWSPGFQLSCAATAGILVLAPRLTARLTRWPGFLARAAGVAAGAQLAVLPLLVFHFRRVSLVALPANLVALPLVGPAMILGLVGGVVAAAWPPAAVPVVKAAGIPVALLRIVAERFAAVPFASVRAALWWVVPAAAGAVLLLGVSLCRRGLGNRPGTPRPPMVRRSAVLLLVGAAVVAACAGLLQFRPLPAPRGLRTTFFDVGQGESALIESPSGARVLVDGGPAPGTVAARLAARRVRRLDLVVFSHDHADHVAGLPAVVRGLHVRAALAPVAAGRVGRRLPPAVRLRRARDGDRIVLGDLVIDVLGPDDRLIALGRRPPDPGPGEGSPVNNTSLVLRVSWGRGCQLFTGDIEEDAQRALLERHRDGIECTVLKAPHHGSARLLPAFVQAVDPEYVAVSVGANTYGHPAPAALAMFDYVGASVLRTDRMGDLVLEMDRGGTVRVR